MGEDNFVEIMQSYSGNPRLLDSVHDRETNTWFSLTMPTGPSWDGVRSLHAQGVTGKGVSCAIIDTGVLSAHPRIASRLKAPAIDFTGEGAEDENGHGTVVSLIFLLASPEADLYSLKVLGADGRGSRRALIEAIDWAADHGVNILNISAGIYTKRWLFWDCDGTCDVCQAAERASNAGCVVTVAAGNEAGETACPATIAMKKDGVGLSVMAYYAWANALQPYSGKGNIAAPDSGFGLEPLVEG